MRRTLTDTANGRPVLHVLRQALGVLTRYCNVDCRCLRKRCLVYSQYR